MAQMVGSEGRVFGIDIADQRLDVSQEKERTVLKSV
jgi:ubiquinone/menaquinone biosynthesis C-methylase UbiE